MTMTRGALISIVFSKVLTVSASVAASKGSSTLTLIMADVENIGMHLAYSSVLDTDTGVLFQAKDFSFSMISGRRL